MSSECYGIDDSDEFDGSDDDFMSEKKPKQKSKISQPPKKVKKTNDSGDFIEETKKQQSRGGRNKSKPVTVKLLIKNFQYTEDSGESDNGQDVDASDEEDDFKLDDEERESSDEE